ncbi:MAG: hypothetical protein L0323_18590 [Planctomycetes bacterium]|nr:hypothetical protein [Planctomycetota bacterium]
MPVRPPNRFFLFHFPIRQTSRERTLPYHELRDGLAAAELMSPLLGEGLEFGGAILNYRNAATGDWMDRLGDRDLLVLPTRPALDDQPRDRKAIQRSGTPLEDAVLGCTRRFFAHCDRHRVEIAPDLVPRLSKPDRGEIEFRVHGDAHYRRHRRPSMPGKRNSKYTPAGGRPLTAAYLLRTQVWEGGPSLLNVFGMEARMTQLWAYLLRTRFARYLRSTFAMVEITTQSVPPAPSDLSFCDRWGVEELLDLNSDEIVPAPRPTHGSTRKPLPARTRGPGSTRS